MNDLPMRSDGPALPYWVLEQIGNGPTTMRPAELTGFTSRSLGGRAAPSYVLDIPGAFQNVSFVYLPVGWVGEWHESPYPQWVVALTGRWFIQTQDGTRIEMGPGDLHWGADQHTAAIGGGPGHRSGQIGDSGCLLMMIQRTTEEES
ncbi:hypothetical protein DVJ78_08245 [Humibacter sp. BT305]|nr:hypothetical protein DVJ78_08245 [Humibacter sp. BT305]